MVEMRTLLAPETWDWYRWIAENILLGASESSIVTRLCENGFNPTEAASAVEMAASHPFVEAGRSLKRKLDKRDWMMSVYHRLQSERYRAGSVERVSRPSREAFFDQYYAANRPVVITDALSDWPALTRWTPEYLKEKAGYHTVEIQGDRDQDPMYEIYNDAHRRTMTFGAYLDLIESLGATNSVYMTANNCALNQPLLETLQDDFTLPTEYLQPTIHEGVFFWYGPQGTVTPLHHDLTNNFMLQVRGRKRILMLPAYETPNVYNHLHCYSRVDPLALDTQEFPHFVKAHLVEVILEPGEILFLPIGWWHHVTGMDVTITITCTNFVADNFYLETYKTFDRI